MLNLVKIISATEEINVLTFSQGFGRRRRMFAKPLLKDHGIASIILENPYCILALAANIWPCGGEGVGGGWWWVKPRH